MADGVVVAWHVTHVTCRVFFFYLAWRLLEACRYVHMQNCGGHRTEEQPWLLSSLCDHRAWEDRAQAQETLWSQWVFIDRPNSPLSPQRPLKCHPGHHSMGLWDDRNTTENNKVQEVKHQRRKWDRKCLIWHRIYLYKHMYGSNAPSLQSLEVNVCNVFSVPAVGTGHDYYMRQV